MMVTKGPHPKAAGRKRTSGKKVAPNKKRSSQKMPPVKGKRKPSPENGRRDRHGLTAGERRAQSRIVFVSGDPSGRYQTMVRRTLKDSFTQDELRVMGHIEVEFGPVPHDNRAVFYRKFKDEGVTSITFDPKLVDEDDIVHEFTHALKAEDTSRTGYAATMHKRIGKRFDYPYFERNMTDISNIEEASVVAESAIRTKCPARTPSGYFDEIPWVGKNPAKMRRAYSEDRLTLLDAPKGTKVKDTRGIQGKAAVNKLNKNFPKTNISKKKQGGRTALASYNWLKSNEK